MNFRFSKGFNKQYHKADKKIQDAFQKRVKLFAKNPANPQLRLHPLSGKLKGYYSINITGDWRALYKVKDSHEEIIYFEMLGTHSQLYK